MAGRLELTDQEFLKIIINMLRALTEKVDSAQTHKHNVSRGMKNSRKE